MIASEDYYAGPELAELYDYVPLYRKRPDVRFYVDVCQEAGEALELGCGTGRVLIPAAESGCQMTGLDWSEGMLGRCRNKVAQLPDAVRERIRLVRGDMTSFHLGRKFKLITVPFRPFQHLTAVAQQLRLLESAREHLEPGGRLVFDVYHPKLELLVGPLTGEEVEDTPEVLLEDGRTLRRTYLFKGRNLAEQFNDVELIYYVGREGSEPQRIVQAFPMRYFFRYEMEHLLARAGFEVAALYGSWDRSEFGDASPEMIFTAVVRP